MFMLTFVTIATVTLFIWFSGLLSTNSYQLLPVMNEPFLESIVVINHETGTPIGSSWPINVGTGEYISFHLNPSPKTPDSWNGHLVQDPNVWATEIWIWPEKKASVRSDQRWPIQIPMRVFEPADDIIRTHPNPVKPWEKPIVHEADPNFYAEIPQYFGRLRCGSNETPSNLIRGGFVALPKESCGEFIVEIRLYPMTYWRSAIRYEMGPDIVVWRSTVTTKCRSLSD